MRFLEQQNRVLETKWKLLQEQGGTGPGGRNLDSVFEAFLSGLRRQLDGLASEKQQLDAELKSFQDMVEDSKHKCVGLGVVVVGWWGKTELKAHPEQPGNSRNHGDWQYCVCSSE